MEIKNYIKRYVFLNYKLRRSIKIAFKQWAMNNSRKNESFLQSENQFLLKFQQEELQFHD